MADLDPALVERMRSMLFGNSTFGTNETVEAVRVERALLSLGIPAAALNALARGEAKVWPVEPTREMWAAGANVVVDRRRLHHDTVTKRVITAMDAASPYRSDT